ncbi:hypothetical protein [Streptomyces sp. NPDC017991]|uniref:hypothetical protein n=1 Tax=Streptomyces sp. NPDC017991 TaxID=3365026 RepID=UPI003797413D
MATTVTHGPINVTPKGQGPRQERQLPSAGGCLWVVVQVGLGMVMRVVPSVFWMM